MTGTLGPLQVEVHHWSTWDDQMKTMAICPQTSPPQALPDKASANVSIQLSMPWSPGKTSRTMRRLRRWGQKDSLMMMSVPFFGWGQHTPIFCHKISQEDGKGNQPTPVTVCPCHTSRGAQCIFHRGLLHLSASTYLYTVKIKPVQPRVSKTHGYILSKYANVC